MNKNNNFQNEYYCAEIFADRAIPLKDAALILCYSRRHLMRLIRAQRQLGFKHSGKWYAIVKRSTVAP